MLLRNIVIFLIFAVFFYSCGNAKKESPAHPKSDSKQKTDETISTEAKDIKLKVTAKIAVLRSAPDAASAEFQRLKDGDVL